MKHSNWTKLLVMSVISFISMYAIMYLMVNVFSDVYANLNQLYMVLAMVSVMVIIEILIMGDMYNKKVKLITILLSIIVLITSIFFVRNQTFISDKEFIRSMIPHHSSAILMCDKADIQDIEIQNLCKNIISSQQEEIDWMKEKFLELK